MPFLSSYFSCTTYIHAMLLLRREFYDISVFWEIFAGPSCLYDLPTMRKQWRYQLRTVAQRI